MLIQMATGLNHDTTHSPSHERNIDIDPTLIRRLTQTVNHRAMDNSLTWLNKITAIRCNPMPQGRRRSNTESEIDDVANRIAVLMKIYVRGCMQVMYLCTPEVIQLTAHVMSITGIY